MQLLFISQLSLDNQQVGVITCSPSEGISMKRICISFLMAIALCSLSSAQSQTGNTTVDPKLYQELRWRSIGPHRGGRVTAVSGVRMQPNTFYMGTVGGGVWKTTNYGITWLPVTDGQIST